MSLGTEYTEADRISFLERRDGIEAAVEFARRGIKLYRKAVLTSRKRGYSKPHHASLPEYRRSHIESYCYYKKYINAN